jgi:hypothetical protein
MSVRLSATPPGRPAVLEMPGPIPQHPSNPDFYRFRGGWVHWCVIVAQRRTPYAVLSEAEAAAIYWWDMCGQELGIVRLAAVKHAATLPHLPE